MGDLLNFPICVKVCKLCGDPKPLTDEHWYRARPTASHPSGGWQSYCKACWKIINKNTREKRKALLAMYKEAREKFENG